MTEETERRRRVTVFGLILAEAKAIREGNSAARAELQKQRWAIAMGSARRAQVINRREGGREVMFTVKELRNALLGVRGDYEIVVMADMLRETKQPDDRGFVVEVDHETKQVSFLITYS